MSELDALRTLQERLATLVVPALTGGPPITAAAATPASETANEVVQRGAPSFSVTQQRCLSHSDIVHLINAEESKSGVPSGAHRTRTTGPSKVSVEGLPITTLGPTNNGAASPFSAFNALRQVVLRGNVHLADVPVKYHLLDPLPELRELTIESNPLVASLGPGPVAHAKLEHLTVSGNALRAVPDLSLSHLVTLDLSGNGLTAFPSGSRLPRLEMLDLSRNQLRSLESIAGLTQLSSLAVSCNQLTSLVGIESMVHLEKLDASGNSLRFNRSAALANPLRGCSASLTSLDLSRNDISNVAFFVPLPKMWWFDLSNNPIGGAAHVEAAVSKVTSSKTAEPLDDIGSAAYDDDDDDVPVAERSSAKATPPKRGARSAADTVSVHSRRSKANSTGKPPPSSGSSLLSKLVQVCPLVEVLNVAGCPCVSTIDDLHALSKLSRLSDLTIDPIEAEEPLRPQASQEDSSEDERRGPGAMQRRPSTASMQASVASLVPTLETLNGAPIRRAGTRPAEVPLTARTAAANAVSEDEILAQVLDPETLSALRDIGFDATRARQVSTAATADSRPASARPSSASQRPTSARLRQQRPPAAGSSLVDPSALRRDLEDFLDQLESSKEYVDETLDRMQQRISWAYGRGGTDDDPTAASARLHPPMHEAWFEKSQARRAEMEHVLAASREARNKIREDRRNRQLQSVLPVSDVEPQPQPPQASVGGTPIKPSSSGTPTHTPKRPVSNPVPGAASRTPTATRRSQSSSHASGAARQHGAVPHRSSSASSRNDGGAAVLPTTGTVVKARSFVDEQRAFKLQLQREAEERRHALLQLPITESTKEGPVRGTKKVTVESGTSTHDEGAAPAAMHGPPRQRGEALSVASGTTSPPRANHALSMYRLQLPVANDASEPTGSKSSSTDVESESPHSEAKYSGDGTLVTTGDPRGRRDPIPSGVSDELLRPSSASLNDSARRTSMWAGSSSGCAPTPFVSVAVKSTRQDRSKKPLSVVVNQPTTSAIGAGLSKGLVVPVTGCGPSSTTAPSPSPLTPSAQRDPSNPLPQAASAANTVASALLRTDTEDVYRAISKPATKRGGASLNRRR